MVLKFIFYLFVLKSAFGFGLRYPGNANDYKYNDLLSGWMKLHEERADWLTARVNCHMEGAFLASPWSADFTRAVHDLMRENLLFGQDIKRDMLWSGVHSSFDEGALKFVHGQQVVSLRHDDMAPLERCGVFAHYFMDEVHCDTALPYICYRPGLDLPSMPERPVSPPELNPSELPQFLPTEQTYHPRDIIIKTLKKMTLSSTELPLPEPAPSTEAVLVIDPSKCGDVSLGYQFAELTGHCYKFHAHAVPTWDHAKSACEEEGAYLAIVNSDEEVEVLKKIYAKKIYGARFPDTAAIGFYKDGYSWITLKGESIEEAGYAKWRPEAPHFRARLGFIARDGLLYGYVRDVRDVPYICEKPALKLDVSQATESTDSKTISIELEKGIMPRDSDPVTDDEDESIELTSVNIMKVDEEIGLQWPFFTTALAEETDEAIKSEWNTESGPVTGEPDEAIKSEWNTELVPVAEGTDEPINSEWNTESVSVRGEPDDAIKSEWNTELVPVAEGTDEPINSEWNTETVSVRGEPDDAIKSEWNTESVPAAEESEWNTESVSVLGEPDQVIKSEWNTESGPVTGEPDEAIKSEWNTELVPVAEGTDEPINSEWNTESVSVKGEPDDAIKSEWNTESVPAAEESEWNTESVSVLGEPDQVIKSEWNTEAVPLTGEPDEAIKSEWATESVPVPDETDETITSIWNTESDKAMPDWYTDLSYKEPEDYFRDYSAGSVPLYRNSRWRDVIRNRWE